MNKEPDAKPENSQQLDGGTYEIIQNRLQKQKEDLQQRLQLLNAERKVVFGSLETQLIANDRITTENSCVARDIVSLGNKSIFGYNVHFGLRTDINLKDVFSIYTFKENHFHEDTLALIDDSQFKDDFHNLYKYYRNTIFTRFAKIGNYLFMVFQLSDSTTDIKVFKWLIKDDQLQYEGDRFEHEYKYPSQQEFNWVEAGRDMQRYGEHPHMSILDKVFVETVGGDLTIKIEDNTLDGRGIYSEEVEYRDQTLDDGQFRFADLGNLIVLEIKPFQEQPRYFVYNHKLQEVNKIQSIKDSCVLLPDEQGIIFPTGYYLQTGEYNIFDNSIPDVKFLRKIASPNGEDYLYVFYSVSNGLYNLMSYNIISQTISTPIICNGYTIMENGELCYFRTEEEQTKHHMIQIWQTPYISGTIMPSEHQDTMLFKIGNKDIVKAMAEANALITLLNKKDSYDGLYSDIAKGSKDIIDSYYWLPEQETHQINIPLEKINDTANSAIDEFKKVVQLKKNARLQTKELEDKAQLIFGKTKTSSFNSIDDFVFLLTKLRELRGETITLKEVRYVDTELLQKIEEQITEHSERISTQTVEFLLQEDALAPYQERVEEKNNELNNVEKVIEAKQLEEEVNQIAADLELLIDIVTNLEIEDTSHSTKIIDNISLIFSTINQLKAGIKNKKQSLGSEEAQADFAAQLKLIDQSVINYFDIADTAEKCDEYQNKVSIQLEELEGKFAEYPEFIDEIMEKREEVYAAFDSRKSFIQEKRNKRIISFKTASERILKGIAKKAKSLSSETEINAYFASDLMVNKVRDIIEQLRELEDTSNAEEISTKLKTAREDAIRQLKDKRELYEDGENIIKFGKHKFGVNKQPLDVTIVHKDGKLMYHITSTDFYQTVENDILTNQTEYWSQELVSENDSVYRSSYLAYKLFHNNYEQIKDLSKEELLEFVQKESSQNYSEGYTKGVHDIDATKILVVLLHLKKELGLLTYETRVRAYTQFFWHSLEEQQKQQFNRTIKIAGQVSSTFHAQNQFDYLLANLQQQIEEFSNQSKLFSSEYSSEMANYLFEELKSDDDFEISAQAYTIHQEFIKALKEQNSKDVFKKSFESEENYVEKIQIVRQWVNGFLFTSEPNELQQYADEVVCLILFEHQLKDSENNTSPTVIVRDLKGSHPTINEGQLTLNYHKFIKELQQFAEKTVPEFNQFRETRHKAIEQMKQKLKLSEFQPRILTSFVRNKLINEVYLPIIGDNLAKQLGSLGEGNRTDRMGMLLLISPPGYGKTTLMEYVANRLGLVFMKINGPAIGHEVTSVDPAAANNSAAREELKKLNLAFEMGNNVMLYLDDIQHCHPEFLQKFISLSDGTRRIEGVFNGEPKTYNLRSKKFCVIMAGNPYTEKGTRFQVPDMLANRSDIYNLGDIIGDSAHLFKLSLIENALTSNSQLNQLRNKNFDDIYALLDRVENNNQDSVLQGNHTNQEIQDYSSVLEKIIAIRDTVLKVNELYIQSAGMEDEYRTEPAFKLQGSYRDMNKLVAKVVPIMNDKELETLLLTHYESESQTLTSAAEANLLKYKEISNSMSNEERERWNKIRETFQKNNKLKGFGNQNEMAQLLSQLVEFNENLEGIQNVLKKKK